MKPAVCLGKEGKRLAQTTENLGNRRTGNDVETGSIHREGLSRFQERHQNEENNPAPMKASDTTPIPIDR